MSERRRFPSACRLRRHREFQRVHSGGIRCTDRNLTVWGLPNRLDVCRLGLVVGRRHGNAVQRNRRKRVLREAFRLSRHRLPIGVDLAAMPRVGAPIVLGAWRRSLEHLAERIAKRLGVSPPTGAGS